MDIILNKCFKASKQIIENSLPTMEKAYKQYTERAKDRSINHQCLNQSKKYTAGAKEIMGQLKQYKKVYKNLQTLERLDVELKMYSKKLNDKLNYNKNEFTELSKKFSEVNKRYLEDTLENNRPASEILQDLVSLLKDIQDVTNNTIVRYRNDIDGLLQKAENEICNEAQKSVKTIQEIDASINIDAGYNKPWTHVEPSFFDSPGAFVFSDYD